MKNVFFLASLLASSLALAGGIGPGPVGPQSHATAGAVSGSVASTSSSSNSSSYADGGIAYVGQVSAQTGDSTSHVGDLSQENYSPSSASITSYGSKIPLQTPVPTLAPVSTNSGVFVTPDQAAPHVSIPIEVWAARHCNKSATRSNRLRPVRAKGGSGLSTLVFSPTADYALYGEREEKPHSSHSSSWRWDSDDASPSYKYKEEKVGARVRPLYVRVAMDSTPQSGVCLGTLSVHSSGKGREQQVFLSELISDAQNFTLDNLSGFRNIDLISLQLAIATPKGVESEGSGFGMSPSLVSSFANMLSLGSIGLAANKSWSRTAPTEAGIGVTFVLLATDSRTRAPRVNADLSGDVGKFYIPSETATDKANTAALN